MNTRWMIEWMNKIQASENWNICIVYFKNAIDVDHLYCSWHCEFTQVKMSVVIYSSSRSTPALLRYMHAGQHRHLLGETDSWLDQIRWDVCVNLAVNCTSTHIVLLDTLPHLCIVRSYLLSLPLLHMIKYKIWDTSHQYGLHACRVVYSANSLVSLPVQFFN